MFWSLSFVKKIIFGLKWDRFDDKSFNEKNYRNLNVVICGIVDGFLDGSKVVGRFFKREVYFIVFFLKSYFGFKNDLEILFGIIFGRDKFGKMV